MDSRLKLGSGEGGGKMDSRLKLGSGEGGGRADEERQGGRHQPRAVGQQVLQRHVLRHVLVPESEVPPQDVHQRGFPRIPEKYEREKTRWSSYIYTHFQRQGRVKKPKKNPGLPLDSFGA